MDYERLPVENQYAGLGPVMYDGFIFDIDDQEYLLEWDNAIVWEFAESCYNHIEIAVASLRRIVNQEPVDGHELGDKNLAVFLMADERYPQLAGDLIAEGFPNYYHPYPDAATYDCYIALSADVGHQMLETWLGQNH